MKYKLLATLLTAAMIMAPVMGFWHPPPPDEEFPPCPVFGVLINDEWAFSTDPYIFEEPEDNFCDTFTVKVGIVNVTDLYGYDFTLTWNTYFFNLVSYTVEQTWPSQFQVYPAVDYDLSEPYHQVVSAMYPSLGVSGDFLLATLVFHINNDVSCHDGQQDGLFNVEGEMSNSCSGEIEQCDDVDAYWVFKPVVPTMRIDPAEINCSKIGTTFTITVWLEDIVKMTDFTVDLVWDSFAVDPYCGAFYTQLLYTTEEDVVINEAVFPTANRSADDVIVNAPECGAYDAPFTSDVFVTVTMEDGYPLINGTVWLFKVTFVQCDPWYCGAQPEYYIDYEDHVYTTEHACTTIGFHQASVSVSCMQGPAVLNPPDCMLLEQAEYCFIPIPGDLDGSGHTGIEDLMILSMFYGLPADCTVPDGMTVNAFPYFYDLNNDTVIDIYDLVVVAKNFCRDKP